MRIALVLNPNAGTLRGLDPEQTAEELAQIFRGHGHSVEISVPAGDEVVQVIRRICREESCEAIVVGGGDGTVSAAASAAAESGLVLGILPLGTMNLFARSLAIPLEMRTAAEALAGGSVGSIDIGEVNGRLFIHHVTLGLHPRVIRVRERRLYSSKFGKIWANIMAWWIVVRQPPRLVVRITSDDSVLERRTAAILVTNNPLGEGHMPYADDLAQGKLGLYIPTSRRWTDLLQLTAMMTVGEISHNALLESRTARMLGIAIEARSVTASVDGEIVSLTPPLEFTIRHRGLRVLHPATPL